MTDLQLEIMRLGADKTLSFGCIVEISDTYYDAQKYKETNIGNRVKTLSNDIIEGDYIVIGGTVKNKILQIIGHPITRGRLCYLNNKINIANINIDLAIDISNKFNAIETKLNNNPSLYNKTILERPEETQLLVREFLLSIQ